MSVCGHKWEAPYLLPPGTTEIRTGGMRVPVRGRTTYVAQKCSLPAGHEGVHRSRHNVTKENR